MTFGKRHLALPFLLAIVVAVGVAPCWANDATAIGNPVPREVARRVAVNHLNSVSARGALPRLRPLNEKVATEVVTATRQGRDLYYVFDLGELGWVIVAADYVASPIIAYSNKGHIRLDDPPPAFTAWMEEVENEIYDAITNRLAPLEKATQSWTTLNIPAVEFQSRLAARGELQASLAAVSTLMSTTWSQGGKPDFLLAWAETYDYYCPREVSVGHYRVAPTGCVATAMGQIMKYHAWPPTGEGSHAWDPPHVPGHGSGSTTAYTTYNSYSVNFSTRSYSWASMPNVVTSEWWDIDANEKKVGQVLRDIGVAVEMKYTPSGSGACTWRKDTSPGGACFTTCDATAASTHGSLKAFHDYFRYHGKYAAKTSGTTTCRNDTAWKTLLKQELDAARPMLYSGRNGGGHAFVCDGYDSSDRFHFNWGWGGSHDGYYAIGDLTPGSHSYSAGNSIVYDIHPDTPPIASCKAATLYLNPSGQATLSTSAVNNGSYDPDGSPVSLQVNRTQFSCSHVGSPQSVTLTVTDNTGNADTCSAVVTVMDNAAPTVITKNISVPLNASGQASITANDVNNGSSDNCGIASRTVSPSSFTCANTGPNTVTLTVTDVNGNTAAKTATVIVVDNTLPTISCPADVATDTDPGSSGAVINGLAPTTGDNCSVARQTWTMTGATTGNSPASGINDASGQTFNAGVTQVIYTVEDAVGNEASCQFAVTVADNEVPTISCPVDVAVDTDPGMSSAVVSGLTPTTNDNVGVVLQTWSMSGATSGSSPGTGIHDVSGQVFNVGVTQVTYTVEDAAGNEASCQFAVTVTDNEAPTITVPADVIVDTDPGMDTAVVNGLSPTTNDNVGVVLQTWSITGVTSGSSPGTGIHDVSGQVFNVGVTTVTYYLEDQQGNSASDDFTVTVDDNEAPTLTCPGNVEKVEYSNVCAIVDGLSPTTDDNCGVVLQTWSASGATTMDSSGVGIHDASGETFNVGVTTLAYHCEDEAGNSTDCAFDVHVIPQTLIPTLNEWGLMLMATLLAMGGIALTRRQTGNA